MSATTSLRQAMRKLWMDHTVYTRLYITAFAEIPDAQTVAGRLTTNDLRNALDDLLEDREARTPETRPFACSIDYF